MSRRPVAPSFLAATVITLALANSSAFGESYLAIWNTPVEFGFGTFKMSDSLTHWINDGLMALGIGLALLLSWLGVQRFGVYLSSIIGSNLHRPTAIRKGMTVSLMLAERATQEAKAKRVA